MTRIKKKRHTGNSELENTGHRKEAFSKTRSARRKTKQKGNKAGDRNTINAKRIPKKNSEISEHIGSKKTVPLLPTDKRVQQDKKSTPNLQSTMNVINAKPLQTVSPKSTGISPEVEIVKIEDDPHLNDLLEQLDNGQVLSEEDDLLVVKKMAHHHALMKQLGWLDDSGEEDLIQQFEDAASSLDQYR
ncbi:MAG: GTPase-activating protein [Psychromonas sp.]|nr:GTPase-activating protein [Psychromonas sp.]